MKLSRRFQPVPSAARLASTLALMALLTAVPRAVCAHEPLDQLLASWPPAAAAEARQSFDRLAALDIDGELLEKKLREGVAKQIPPERLVIALNRIGDNLIWLAAAWASCNRPADSTLRRAVLLVGNELLLGGVPREALSPALTTACTAPRPDQRLSSAADLYAHLVGRLDAPTTAAWELAASMVERDETEAAVYALVATLSDITRRRGSLDQPLAVATARLRAGATLRAVRNELQDRFLRD